MFFWLIAGAMTVLIGATLMRAYFWGRTTLRATGGHDLQVYRDQLSEVDRDLARGVLDESTAERVRAEVGRRILSADRAQTDAPKDGRGGPGPMVTVLLAAPVLGIAFFAYLSLGAPGYPDQPLSLRKSQADMIRADRPDQQTAEAQAAATAPAQAAQNDPKVVALVAELRAALATRGDDAAGLVLLTRSELSLGNIAGARDAHQRLVALKGADASRADRAGLLELMVMAAGGYVSPEAEGVAGLMIESDPDDAVARYYFGLMHAQTGRPDLAFTLWRDLLEQSPASAPWVAPLRAGLPDLAARAGVRYSLPELRGPSAADIEAAGELSDADRTAMIEGMVEGLAARLADTGGPASDWAQLIRALGVLGQTDRAAMIWAEAQAVFGNAPDDLAQVTQAARSAGVAP